MEIDHWRLNARLKREALQRATEDQAALVRATARIVRELIERRVDPQRVIVKRQLTSEQLNGAA